MNDASGRVPSPGEGAWGYMIRDYLFFLPNNPLKASVIP